MLPADDAGQDVTMSRTLDLLEVPWVFTQQEPETTRSLTTELKRRGVHVDAERLRFLHELRLLSPLLEIVDSPVRQRAGPWDEPRPMSTYRSELRAQSEGRVRDPQIDNSDVRFDGRTPRDPRGWWNGLIYSRWQLLDIRAIRSGVSSIASGTPASELSSSRAQTSRELALILSALEARYLPVIEGDWMHLRGDKDDTWDSYRAGFDASAMLTRLGIPAADVATHAETLLFRAHGLDPSGRWGELIRRAPRKTWDSLTNEALSAMDLRIAAEILLLFYDDLVHQSVAEPLADPKGRGGGWHHSNERLSYRPDNLDAVLTRLGVSPHPRVVLMVEGETEELLFRRVFAHLGLDRQPHLMRIVCMRSADRPLALLAAATVAPILGQRRGDGYDLLRPPCRLVIAVDQDRRWDTDDKAERERLKIVEEIQEVVKAQAADADIGVVDELVEVRRWRGGRCFELEHFNNDELLDALSSAHGNSATWPGVDAVMDRLTAARTRRYDIKYVWHDWRPEPSKVRLAEDLWPVLREKIDRAQSGSVELPQIAQIAINAYYEAQRYARGTWVLGLASPVVQGL
jgi:hypothetical protein